MPATPRGQRTRQLIIERASAVFAEKGFAAASMNDLLASTGMTRGALYFHFESKDEIAAAIVQSQADRWPPLLARVRQMEPDPVKQLLRLAFEAASAIENEPLIRGAHRLMAERASARGELPGTYTWWVTTVKTLLEDADGRGGLADLSWLVSDEAVLRDPVAVLAEYIVARWAGLQQAATASGLSDLVDRAYAGWVLLLPWLSRDTKRQQELYGYIRLLAKEMRSSRRPVVDEAQSSD